MKTVKKQFGIAFPHAAIGVSVEEVDVFEDGSLEADFAYCVRRWHPAFWAYAFKFSAAVIRHHGIDPMSLEGIKALYIGMKTLFDFYSPENKDDDDRSGPVPPSASVVMAELPVAAKISEALKDLAPRWFFPSPGILK